MVPMRVAVFVDGDNISANHADEILSRASGLGRADAIRVYCNASQTSDWLVAASFRLIHAGAGKNGADLLLSIDAMELALLGGFDAFAVASSDGDFTHLAQRLRERGLHVLGLGEDKAPESFRLACTEFVVLNSGSKKHQQETSHAGGGPSALDQKIRTMIAQHSKKGLGMRLSDLAPKMHLAHGTRISTHPERNWRRYLSNRPALYDIDPRGPDATVRFRPDGFQSD